MMKRLLILLFIAATYLAPGQSVNVQADYSAMGDVLFSAYNNTATPKFLHIKLADLENTVFTEPVPYVKRLEPGFNSLFTLQRDPDADVPRFNYELKVYKSNPTAKVDLKYPYLLPFKAGTKLRTFEVKDIDGFWGQEELESWYATGFYAESGEEVLACRNGIVVEVSG